MRTALPIDTKRTLGVRERIIAALSVPTPPVAGRLTLLLLVLYAGRYWDVKVPLIILAALGMMPLPLVRSRWFWGAITASLLISTFPRLYVVDNHKILMVYWVIGIFLSGQNPRLLSTNARLLIGWSFFFAFLWKAISVDFINGSFLHLTILTDPRFTSLARLTGISGETLLQNRSILGAFVVGLGHQPELVGGQTSETAARLLSWWTLAIEGCVALSFLLSRRHKIFSCSRNPVLLVFLMTTYPVATVIGFGWLLCIMGYAQTRCSEPVARGLFLLCFIALQVFTVPWAHILTGG